MTVNDLLTEVFQDLTVLAAGDTLSSTLAAVGLSRLTRLFDSWNAERAAVYANRLVTYTLVPSLQPHTIGPTASSPTFTVTQRPVSIDGATLVLTDVTPNVYRELTLRDIDWWQALTVPTLTASIPTDLYYSPEWPLGKLYLWPVPTTAYGLELQTRIVLDALLLTDTLTMPPGYRDAIALTLGEMIAVSFPTAVPDPAGASRARARIFANNDPTPSLVTQDAGIPMSSSSTRATFNYRTGL